MSKSEFTPLFHEFVQRLRSKQRPDAQDYYYGASLCLVARYADSDGEDGEAVWLADMPRGTAELEGLMRRVQLSTTWRVHVELYRREDDVWRRVI